MPSFENMKQDEATPYAEKLYESFGVKSLIVLKGNEWINVFTIIQLTRRKVEDLNKEYHFIEERLGKIDNNNFKIILQAKPIQEFQSIITELKSGYLKIGDLKTKLLAKNPQEIGNQGLGHYGNLVSSGEYAEYNYYSATVNMDQNPYNFLYEAKISPTSFGLRDFDELACSWLGMSSLQDHTNICITYPIYATINQIQYQGGNEIKITLKVDEHFFENTKIWLNRSPPGDRVPIIERYSYELAACEKTPQDGFYYITLFHEFSAINIMDKLSVALLNSELGQLTKKEMTIYDFPLQDSGPFTKAFNLFDAGKKMEEHLFNPKNSKDLEEAFTWLLEMINITAIRLGKDEAIREEEKMVIGAADILAIYSESNADRIIVIDCTASVPDGNKIDKIKNTADYISRKISYPIKPVIVTSQNTSLTKDEGKKHGVKIIDRADIEKMIGFYKKGHDHPASQVLLSI